MTKKLGTCSFCQRRIAIIAKGQKLAPHGCPSLQKGTALPCEGSEYPPLESSLLGLRVFIRKLSLHIWRLRKEKALEPSLALDEICTEMGYEEYCRRAKENTTLDFLYNDRTFIIETYKLWQNKEISKRTKN